MRRVILSSAQLLLLVAAYLGFFGLMPWLACRPLGQLPPERRSTLVLPSDARCFTYEHGEIEFHRHGIRSEEPVRFGFQIAAVAVPLGLLRWSVARTSRWQRWASQGAIPTRSEIWKVAWLAGFLAAALALSSFVAQLFR